MALIAIKYGDPTDTVTVTGGCSDHRSQLRRLPGSIRGTNHHGQLLYGLMLPSGNDAGAAIAGTYS